MGLELDRGQVCLLGDPHGGAGVAVTQLDDAPERGFAQPAVIGREPLREAVRKDCTGDVKSGIDRQGYTEST
ncbi:MAG: hypothetical protein ACREX8_01845 [Gammaproteobacteria bacterium]